MIERKTLGSKDDALGLVVHVTAAAEAVVGNIEPNLEQMARLFYADEGEGLGYKGDPPYCLALWALRSSARN